MNILALDTSMAACSATVLRADGVAASRRALLGRGCAEALFPMIQAVMAEAGLAWSGLSRVAVTLGPGSFTGVRAGVAAARGIALAAGIPAVGALSLDVLAEALLRRTAPQEREGGFAIAQDARRGEVYFALYGASGARLSEPQALPPEVVAGLLPRPIGCVAGTGAVAVAEAAAALGHDMRALWPDAQPDARDLARLALHIEPSAQPLTPVYLRAPDAEPQMNKALARKGEMKGERVS